MIIVSQNKNCITDDLNICTDKHELESETVYTVENESFILGEYKTEERAKDVLQEITEEYLNCNIEYCGMGYVKNKVYEMPKE